ncbi:MULTISPECIES: hypothetical protein [unclassified Acinetobacter]|uniref:hypothetical protein n=1 Tax=unclassified Acinetobacter TaxID=196816 RepID=UPI0029341F45|nr:MULTISPECIES: hypothetical protein [unclassified Acinetobacter]WOE32895.1 hypothetical protein QSG84_06965 [Acinetobacter sp. SAAs470]WOE38372.1 hypothetical protein QSG86_16020 [Acinetobacter sp. SAAs474]
MLIQNFFHIDLLYFIAIFIYLISGILLLMFLELSFKHGVMQCILMMSISLTSLFSLMLFSFIVT